MDTANKNAGKIPGEKTVQCQYQCSTLRILGRK